MEKQLSNRWSVRVSCTSAWPGEFVFYSEVFGADTFEALVVQTQQAIADDSWSEYRITPLASNPPRTMDEYAVAFGKDLPGFPWGEETPIRDYFEVRADQDDLWIRSTAQLKIDDLLD